MDEYIEKIYIPLEEYKELLMIKGKYEELQSIYYGPYTLTKPTYRKEDGIMAPPYKFTCNDKSVTFNNDTLATYTKDSEV